MNAYSGFDFSSVHGRGASLRDLSSDLLCAIDQYRAESDNSLLVMTLARLITLLRRHYVTHQRDFPEERLAQGHARLAGLMRARAEAMGRIATEIERYAARYDNSMAALEDFPGFRHDTHVLIGMLAEGMEALPGDRLHEAVPMPPSRPRSEPSD